MEEDVFHVGLCMAGAVSAGAYTSGVMDYLAEAPDEWEIKKKSGETNVPMYRVRIPVIGGDPAGGMTSIITAAAINNVKPVEIDPPVFFCTSQPQNPFYHARVDGRERIGSNQRLIDET